MVAGKSKRTIVGLDKLGSQDMELTDKIAENRQQEMLRAIIEDISSELELRPLLTAIVRYACELLNADRGTIGLVDADRNVMRIEAAHNMPDDEIGSEFGSGVGLAGSILERRE